MRKVWVIAANTLVDLRQQRVVWIAVVTASFLALGAIAPFMWLSHARASGQVEMADRLGASIIEGIIGAWAIAAYILGTFQGSSAIASELRSKTIVSVLARPLTRSQYLLGRLAGVQALALGFFLVGLLAVPLLALWFELPIAPSLWPPVAVGFVRIISLSTLGFALGTVMSAQVAATLALLLPVLPTLSSLLSALPNETASTIGWLLFVLGPSKLPDSVIDSFKTAVPRYDLFALVLSENLLYAAAAFLLACWWFGRREIRLDG